MHKRMICPRCENTKIFIQKTCVKVAQTEQGMEPLTLPTMEYWCPDCSTMAIPDRKALLPAPCMAICIYKGDSPPVANPPVNFKSPAEIQEWLSNHHFKAGLHHVSIFQRTKNDHLPDEEWERLWELDSFQDVPDLATLFDFIDFLLRNGWVPHFEGATANFHFSRNPDAEVFIHQDGTVEVWENDEIAHQSNVANVEAAYLIAKLGLATSAIARDGKIIPALVDWKLA